MTCPRELSLRHGALHQRRAAGTSSNCAASESSRGRADDAPTYALGAAELQLTPQGAFRRWRRRDDAELGRRAAAADARIWLPTAGGAPLRRGRCICSCTVRSLQREIFINHGEAVMSARYFPAVNRASAAEQEAPLAEYWLLTPQMLRRMTHPPMTSGGVGEKYGIPPSVTSPRWPGCRNRLPARC